MLQSGYAGPERPAQEDLDTCTRCGFCEQVCPTYRALRFEPDSPRGRIFLMKEVADGQADVNEHMAEHLYVCLGCRACETACPSGVPFGRLLEYGRHQVEQRGEIAPWRRGWRTFRSIAFEWILPNKFLFALLILPARLLQWFPGFARLVAAVLPSRLADLVRMIPQTDGRSGGSLRPELPAIGGKRARVGVFGGCVMSGLFGHTNQAMVRVLRHNGCEVVAPRAQWCCGALNVHAGERDRAKAMARRNIEAFEAAGVDAIVVDSAGCGAHMKEYGELLRHDPAYARRAEAFQRKVKDVSEFLVDLGVRTDFGALRGRITYQDACHLVHAQRIREQPRALLKLIPGLEFVELRWADRCCGAAGVYSLTHRELSQTILEEKMDCVEASGADIVVTGNPGCHMQLQAGIAKRGLRMRVRHLVELLDEAYAARV